MSSVPKRLLTEEEYLARERAASYKSEYYRGETFAMAGASRAHNLIVQNVSRHMGNQLENRPCEVYPAEMRVRVTATRLYTYPDVTVVCEEPAFADDEKDVLLNPSVLVEVLSPSTANYDRGDKAVHYRRLESLRELLLVEQDCALVEQLIRQSGDDWLLKRIEGLDAVVELRSISCRLPLCDIYARITFPPDARPPLRPLVAGLEST